MLLAAWVILAALLLLELLPDHPRTGREWLLLFLFGPPVYVAVELASERILRARTGATTSATRLSFGRILVAVGWALIVLAPFVWWALRRQG